MLTPVEWKEVPAALVSSGDRRFEGEAYLLPGYGLRVAVESQRRGWTRFDRVAKVTLPNRTTGILVDPSFGEPYLTPGRFFDVRPRPRKWVAVEKIGHAKSLYVKTGQILVSRSGTVGKTSLAYNYHEKQIVSDDLLRVKPKSGYSGWVYAFLRAPKAVAIMTATHYGHIIKHLEPSHLESVPIPKVRGHWREHFQQAAEKIIQLRERAYQATSDAEDLFAKSIGIAPEVVSGDDGFEIDAASYVLTGRRRFDAHAHNPTATGIVKALASSGRSIMRLRDVTTGVYWMKRFKRFFGESGQPYVSADELFALNPVISKRILTDVIPDAQDFYPKASWLIMACSGQIYGMIGSVELMTKQHEQLFLTHDLIRIVPVENRIRSGYLKTVLSHPTFGRPLVVRHAYGTSIPHLEPSDVASTEVVRLDDHEEEEIANLAETSIRQRMEADKLENSIADEADQIIERVAAGDLSDTDRS